MSNIKPPESRPETTTEKRYYIKLFENELWFEYDNLTIEDLNYHIVIDNDGHTVVRYLNPDIQIMWKWFKRGLDAPL